MMNLRSKFNDKQLEVIKKAGFDLSDDIDYSDDELCEIEEAVSDYFAYNGLSDNDEVNSIGLICESIMDILAES